MISEHLSTSPEETFRIGQTLGACLKGNEMLLLHGDLGAGKTLLTKGIAVALGIDPDEVVSPTFTLMNKFSGHFPIYHIDLYRLGELRNDTLPEIDDNIGEGVILIEWAQYLDPSYGMLDNAVNIRFHIGSEENRKLEINTSLDYIHCTDESA